MARSAPPGPPAVSPAAAGFPPWWNLIRCTDKGAAMRTNWNGIVAIENEPLFVGAIAHDAFAACTMAMRALPWNLNGVFPRPWTDNDDRECSVWLQENYIILTETQAHSVVETIAERHRFHPVVDYLNGLVWDGVGRLDTWLIYYLGCDDLNYVRKVGRKWLMSLVKRGCSPGCKVDSALILEGPQGIGKSTALSIIGGQWYSNDISALGSKDAKEQLFGKWLIELNELDAVTRARDLAAVKSFVSMAEDYFRRSYGRRAGKYPRQCVFAGTTNRDVWQRDDTGGRRWWPVRCGSIDLDALRHDRDQLWPKPITPC